MKSIINFFDKLEDRVRSHLSRHPIAYALIGGVGIVLFWKGIWDIADSIPYMYGPLSLIIGTIILLMTGVFVSAFIGTRIIISGLKGEKKVFEKTEDEIKDEETEIKHVENTLHKIEKEISEMKK